MDGRTRAECLVRDVTIGQGAVYRDGHGDVYVALEGFSLGDGGARLHRDP